MLGVDASRDCPQKGFQAANIVSLRFSHCHIRWSGGHVVLTALMKNPHIISFVPCHCHREASRGCWVGGEEKKEVDGEEGPQSIVLQLQ